MRSSAVQILTLNQQLLRNFFLASLWYHLFYYYVQLKGKVKLRWGWGTGASVCLLGNFIMEGFISLRAQNLHNVKFSLLFYKSGRFFSRQFDMFVLLICYVTTVN